MQQHISFIFHLQVTYYFSKNNPKGLVYIMGSEAMESELNAMGFKIIGVGKGTIL